MNDTITKVLMTEDFKGDVFILREGEDEMDEFENFRAQRLATLYQKEKQAGHVSYFWLSFADEATGFKGVIITQACGLLHAIQKTHDLNINPGGQVLSAKLPEEPPQYEQAKDRLLSKQQLIEFGFIDAEEPPNE